jgi:phosphatidate cytidylyltransferase
LSVLHRRIASGVVYGLVSLLAVYLGGLPFLGAVLAMAILAGYEYQRMVAHAGYQPLYFLQLGLTVFLVLGVAYLEAEAFVGVLVLIVVSSLAWQLTRMTKSEQPFVGWALTLAGGLYVGWLSAYFVKLRGLPGGMGWMLLALAATWSCDSFAYLIGRRWGRRSFFASVSPHKTWEGALAGWAGAMLVVLVGGLAMGLSVPEALALGGIASLAAICGDLVESMIKRQVGVKDSGGLVPGHGGILDRVDSLLFVVVLVYYFVAIVMGG